MIRYFINKRRIKILNQISTITEIDYGKLETIFRNVEFNRTTRVELLESKAKLIENLWQVTDVNCKIDNSFKYSEQFGYITFAAQYRGKIEEIIVIRGSVKPGYIQKIDGRSEFSTTVHPIIEKNEIVIFVKNTTYLCDYFTPQYDEQTIYVYVP